MAERPYLTQIGSADVTPSFSGLRTITRRYKVSGRAAKATTVDADCFRAYSTADDEFTDALLVEKRLDAASGETAATEKILTEVYREFEDGEKVQVGDDVVTRDENNRATLVRRSVAKASQAEDLTNDAGTVSGIYGCIGSQVAKNGVGAIITETYVQASETLEQIGPVTPITIDDQGVRRFSVKCFGLLTGEWTPTPTGTPLTYETIEYALVGERVEQNAAVRTVYRDYQAATDDLMQLGKDREILRPNGQKGIVRTFFQRAFATWTRGVHGAALTVSSVDYVLAEEDKTETQAIRTVTRTYLQKGEIGRAIKTYVNGFVITRVTTFADATVPTVSGGTLALTQVDDAASPSATPTRVYTFVSSNGVFSTSIQTRTDGLRAVTVVSMGVKNTPSGEVVSDVESEDEGMKRWSVTVMQARDGGAVSGATLEIGRQERFTMPGRVKAYTSTVGTNNILGVYVSPPQDVDVEATVTITYATTKGTAPSNLWEMTEGCTMVAKFEAVPYGVGVLKTEYYPDCRAEGTGASITGSGSAGDGISSVFGYRIWGGTTATITLKGGPADPGGTTKTLAWTSEPAFTTTTGTVWYRRVAVAASIPTQPNLPSTI